MNKKPIAFIISLVSMLPSFADEGTVTDANSEELINYDLNPVVVTGTYTNHRLKDTPVPVQVITASEIRTAGIDDIQTALTMMVPSLSFSPNAMGSYLRLNGLTNSHVLILINGRKLIGDISGNVDLGQIDINTIQRIEVLNGAASTLYGSDAVGGVINIITKQPSDDVEFNSHTSYTRKNQFNQGLNLSLHPGRVGSLTNFNYSHSDGWQNNNMTLSGDELIPTLAQLSLGFTSSNFGQKFTIEASDRLKLYAEGSYYHRILDRPLTNPDITGGTNYNTMSESWSWGAGGSYTLGSIGTVKLDYSGRTFGQWYKYMIATGDYLPGDYQETKRQIYNDVQLTGLFNFSSVSSTVIGLEYRDEVLRRTDSDLDKSLGAFSAFAQHEQKILGHFTGIAGLRYDGYETLGGRLTPKLSLMYGTGNFNIRGNYAMGYRAPGIDELYYRMFKPMGSRYVITFGNPDMKSESSNYGSINLEYRSTRFSASVTGYLNFIKNMVTSKSTKFNDLPAETQELLIEEFPELANAKLSLVSLKEYYNYTKAQVRGIEANITYNPFDDLSLSLNYSYAYSRGLNPDGTWQRQNRSVANTFTFTANYGRKWRNYSLNINLNGRAQSKTYYPGDADGDAPGYGIWNLTTRHSFSGLKGVTITPGIGIDNIFNRRDMRPLNSNFALYSPGRSIIVSLSINID